MKVLISAVVLSTVFVSSVYATESTVAVSAKPTNLFVQADKNKDGKLDKDEFEQFKQLEESRITQQIHDRFSQMKFSAYDQDGNGEVTRDELKAVRMMAHQKGKHPVPPVKTVTSN